MPAVALRCLVAAVLVALMSGPTVPIAGAHTVLTATDPAADSTVATGPSRVTATFNEELQPTFAAMTIVGPDSSTWSNGDPEVRGSTVGVAVRPLGPAGRYTVNYRVTSADGHVVTGSWSFTVTATGAGQPGPAVAGAASEGRIALWPLAVGALVVVGAAVLWSLRRRRG